MIEITVTDSDINENNLLYVQSVMSELFSHADCAVRECVKDGRANLIINCRDYYADIIRAEVADKLAEIVAIKYKYDFFKKNIITECLSKVENELLMASLIAADLDDDKKYAFDRLKDNNDIAIDGVYNFRMIPLKNKWKDIIKYIPCGFMKSQLKDFITYLIDSKKNKVYVDCGKVYDSHYRRLKRCALIGGENLNIIREVLLSNCGQVELNGKIPKEDEYYLKEFYTDKISFSTSAYK